MSCEAYVKVRINDVYIAPVNSSRLVVGGVEMMAV